MQIINANDYSTDDENYSDIELSQDEYIFSDDE